MVLTLSGNPSFLPNPQTNNFNPGHKTNLSTVLKATHKHQCYNILRSRKRIFGLILRTWLRDGANSTTRSLRCHMATLAVNGLIERLSILFSCKISEIFSTIGVK